MSIVVENEQKTLQEAMDILLKEMPPSKVARLLCAWQVGRGNYTIARRKLFARETVDSIFEKARTLEKKKRKK